MSPPQLSWPPLTWPLCLYFHLYLFFHKHGITVRSLSCLASWTQHNVSEINLLWVAVVHSFWLEEGIQTARSHMKRCSRSLVLKEMQSKTTRRHSYRLSEQPKTDNTRSWCWQGETGTLAHHQEWEYKLVNHMDCCWALQLTFTSSMTWLVHL